MSRRWMFRSRLLEYTRRKASPPRHSGCFHTIGVAMLGPCECLAAVALAAHVPVPWLGGGYVALRWPGGCAVPPPGAASCWAAAAHSSVRGLRSWTLPVSSLACPPSFAGNHDSIVPIDGEGRLDRSMGRRETVVDMAHPFDDTSRHGQICGQKSHGDELRLTSRERWATLDAVTADCRAGGQ
ncbi:uncharacterized protein LOC119312017 [Triticum dicoccoides]|uniref:uncharacterized protein LOC119312017 n=1 Tax=Triticum dicoccoides TaxID=85692 RepID=UPI00188F4CE3|nr:uncharacterized protein LOC119312017 [Triticum dicoccoides]